MIILAFDPGGSTGWASYDSELENKFDGGQLENEDHHVDLEELIYEELNYFKEYTPNDKFYLVTESFEFRNSLDTSDRRKGLELISKEYIGVMKLIRDKNPEVNYYEQMPSHAKSYISDEKIDKLGLLKRPVTPNRHYHDAMRHLLLFLTSRLKIREGITDKWRRVRD